MRARMDCADEPPICRICFGVTNPFTNVNDLISPCNCSGSVKYVHSTCLKMWRFKGNLFSEIKECEQCRAVYNVRAEHLSQRCIITLLTGSSIALVYAISSFLFSSILNALAIISEDLILDSKASTTRCTLISSSWAYHLTYVMVLMTISKLCFNPTLFSIFNYVFTFWRIIQFGLMVDKGLFIVISFLFLREAFWCLYMRIDRLYFCLVCQNRM